MKKKISQVNIRVKHSKDCNLYSKDNNKNIYMCEGECMKMKSKPKYFLSSTGFETLEEAKEQIIKWEKRDDLDDRCKIIVAEEVYEPTVKTTVRLKKV